MRKTLKAFISRRQFLQVLTVVVVSTLCALILQKNYFAGKEDIEFATMGKQLALSGRNGVIACANCHGKQGEGQFEQGMPRLAGLHPEYIVKQLLDFARDPLKTRVAIEPISRDYSKTPRVNVDLTIYTPGTRSHPVMNSIAKQLTPQEMRNLALYYSNQAFIAKAAPRDFETLARGEDLALRGKPEFGLPACISCHGPEAEGFGSIFPPLAGQPAEYIIGQINKWQNGKRDNDHLSLMRNVANQLTDGDKENVAAYLSNLSFSINAE